MISGDGNLGDGLSICDRDPQVDIKAQAKAGHTYLVRSVRVRVCKRVFVHARARACVCVCVRERESGMSASTLSLCACMGCVCAMQRPPGALNSGHERPSLAHSTYIHRQPPG
jgi:hypothetical protein